MYASTSGGGGDGRGSRGGSGRSSHDRHERDRDGRSNREGERHRDRDDRHGRSSRDSRDGRDRVGSRGDRARDGRDSRDDRGSRDERHAQPRPSSRADEGRWSERGGSRGGASATGAARSSWESTATPLRTTNDDEWADMTPARPGSGADAGPAVAASPWESSTPRRGGTGYGSWDSSSTPALPALSKPGSGSGSRAGRPPTGLGAGSGGRVKFDVAPSPALTPSWKSSSWSKGGGKAGEREASPELRPEGEERGAGFDAAVRWVGG